MFDSQLTITGYTLWRIFPFQKEAVSQVLMKGVITLQIDIHKMQFYSVYYSYSSKMPRVSFYSITYRNNDVLKRHRVHIGNQL